MSLFWSRATSSPSSLFQTLAGLFHIFPKFLLLDLWICYSIVVFLDENNFGFWSSQSMRWSRVTDYDDWSSILIFICGLLQWQIMILAESVMHILFGSSKIWLLLSLSNSLLKCVIWLCALMATVWQDLQLQFTGVRRCANFRGSFKTLKKWSSTISEYLLCIKALELEQLHKI